jgi:hypothetical protein
MTAGMTAVLTGLDSLDSCTTSRMKEQQRHRMFRQLWREPGVTGVPGGILPHPLTRFVSARRDQDRALWAAES